jgi:branched-chain amino acid transport system ATP-binding protein
LPKRAEAKTEPVRATQKDVLLDVADLRSGYGALPVLHGVSFQVNRGETAVLLGLNGAGKSTTVLNLCGAVRPWAGSITFDGADSTRWSTARCVKEGIVLVPEGRRIFPDLSVEKNLQVGSWTQRADSAWVDGQRERVYHYLPRLRERNTQMAGTLSGGEQQMLAIGRGLMANPKLLIIDEASLGLAPVIVKEVFKIVSQVNNDGVTVILVEANISALEIADVGIVFQKGVITDVLRGKQLKDAGRVRQLVLG